MLKKFDLINDVDSRIKNYRNDNIFVYQLKKFALNKTTTLL